MSMKKIRKFAVHRGLGFDFGLFLLSQFVFCLFPELAMQLSIFLHFWQ